MVTYINAVLKAFLAGIGGFVSVLVGATQATDMSWSDLTLNTWLTAVGAFITLFTATYFVPNTPKPAKSKE